MQPLVFDTLAPITVPIVGLDKPYILREADADAKATYQSATARAARFNEEGTVSSVEGLGNVEPQLVAACLYEAECDDKDDPDTYRLRLTPQGDVDKRYLVKESVVRKMKSSVVSKLFDTIKDISEFEEGKETEESLQKQIDKLTKRLNKLKSRKDASKKEQEDTGDTSS